MQEQTTTASEPLSPATLVDQLARFEGSPQQFLLHLLRAQCRIAGAEQGVILRRQEQQGAEVVALYPGPSRGAGPDGAADAPPWVTQVAQISDRLTAGESRVVPVQDANGLYGVESEAHLVLLAMRGGEAAGGVRGVAAFFIRDTDRSRLQQHRRQLELTTYLLDMYEMRLTLEQRQRDLQRLTGACGVLSEINQQARYKAAAMALCNQLAHTFSAERVTFGLLRGRYVKAQAMSHTEKLVRKVELVQAIEMAMEECLDQDLEVVHPEPEQTTVITRAAADLSRRFGPACVLSVPLRREGEVRGVITLERPEGEPFNYAEVAAVRLTAELCTARLLDLSESDRWFGARWAARSRRSLAVLVAPQYTWVKLTALAVVAVLAFAIFAPATYRVDAPFTIEAAEGQVLAAPFSGYVQEVAVRPGDLVTAGQTLATLDTLELRNDLVSALAELEEQRTRAEIARAEDETAEQRVARAGAERVEARIERIRWRLEQAEIRSRLQGIVLSTGDLHKELGKPVDAGQPLFEVAPLEALEVTLAVPESKIAELQVGQKGELAATSHPGVYVPFELTRIEPMAQVADQQNVFRVQAQFLDQPAWLRPNMEGVAKVEIDQRSYAWIWTHELVNWIRMKLWL